MSLPSTTPNPGGTLKAAPSATTGPGRATCAWISQLAVFMASQIPVRFGLPSAVRGALYVWPWLDAGIIVPRKIAAETAAAAKRIAPPTRTRIWPSHRDPGPFREPPITGHLEDVER